MKIQLPNGEVKELSSVSREKEKSSQEGGYLNRFKSRVADSEERIQERGTVQQDLRNKFTSNSPLQRSLGVLSLLAVPADAIESAVANVGLEIQKKGGGIADPDIPEDKNILLKNLLQSKKLANKFWKGLTLQEKGQYGDILKNAGVQSTVADATGLFLNIAVPIKVMSMAGKAFGSISKMSDKGILRSGNQLIVATNKAKEAIGSKVGEAFAGVSDDAVDGLKFLDNVVSLPKPLLKKSEEVFGKLDEFADNITVGKLREFKQFIGKFRPSAYGQSERGISENIDVEDLNKVYALTKDLMKESIKKGHGEKVADGLMSLEKSYSEVSKASQLIKKTVVDPILRKPTKGGKMAEGLIKEGDVSIRAALNTIKKSGSAANKAINDAVRLLEMYNSHRIAANLVKTGLKAMVFGGAAGAVGGKAMQKVTGKD